MNKKYNYNYECLNSPKIFYYLLGAFLTDGNLSYNKKRSNSVSMRLSSKDKDWLKIIQDIINGGSITKYGADRNCYSLLIVNKQFISKFIQFGMIPNKSLTLKCPKIPKEYIPDFLRGVIDGDGCLGVTKNKKIYRPFLSICSASRSFIESIKELIGQLGMCVSINENTQVDHMINGRLISSKNPLYNIRVSHRKALELIKLVNYNSELSLPRKKETALDIMTHYSSIEKKNKFRKQEIINSINLIKSRDLAKKFGMCRKYIDKIIKDQGYIWNNSKKVWETKANV